MQAAELQDLRAPAGMILPLQNGDYDVPHAAGNGAVGKQLDIRPPAQPLALMNGARAQFSGNTGVLMMENSRSGSVWPQVVNVVQSYRFPIASQQDASQQLTTDWVEWNRADEDNQYRGRYQISVQQQGYQQALTVKLLQLQQAGNDVSSPTQIQRYTAQMLNDISTGPDKMETAAQDAAASRSASQIDVQSGADDTGLPNLILRAPFNVSPAASASRVAAHRHGYHRQQPLAGQHEGDLQSAGRQHWMRSAPKIRSCRTATIRCRSAISTTAAACSLSTRKAMS